MLKKFKVGQHRSFRDINESMASKKGRGKNSKGKKRDKHNLQITDLNALKVGGSISSKKGASVKAFQRIDTKTGFGCIMPPLMVWHLAEISCTEMMDWVF